MRSTSIRCSRSETHPLSAPRTKALLVACGLVLAGAEAVAQPAPAKGNADRASLIKQGRLCYRLRDYRCAAERFHRAHTLKPSVKLLFNLASAEDKLQHRAEALRLYRRYFREAKKLPQQILLVVAKRLKRLSKSVGWVSLRVAPQVAVEARVDGLRWFSVTGEFPVAPGVRQLAIRAKGYVPQDRRIRVRQGRRLYLALRLARSLSTLALRSAPSGAVVHLDGARVGRTPLTLGRLVPGPHALRVAKAGEGVAQKIHLAPNRKTTLTLRLRPLRAPLRVMSTPSGAAVQLDGELVGKTPLLRDARVGRRRLVVHRAGYLPSRQMVTITPFAPETMVAMKLEPGRQTSFVTRPPGAEVQLDGKAVGKTPLTLGVPLGKHEVSLRHPAYGLVGTTFTLVPGVRPYRFGEDLAARRRNARRRLWSYVSLGIAAAAGVAAGVLYAHGLSSGDEAHLAYTRATTDEERQRYADQVKSSERQLTVGHVLLAAGVAALGAATYPFLSSFERPSQRGVVPRQAITLGSKGAGLVWRF